MSKRIPLADRFYKFVNKNGPTMPGMDTPCHIWTGATDKKGYGRVSVDRKPIGAHVAAWMLEHGPVPDGCDILHRCDNPPCVRHLYAGTHADNMRDRHARGRANLPRGAAHHFSHFSDEEVRCLRARNANGESILSLSKEADVAFNAMWQIIRRKSYAHVE